MGIETAFACWVRGTLTICDSMERQIIGINPDLNFRFFQPDAAQRHPDKAK
jgi:hypothetical protein